MQILIDDKVLKRFWAKVNKQGLEDCWEWTAHTNTSGYGRLGIGGKNPYAHRISYTIAKGEIPEDLYVCHTCDNPRCVNPGHLWLGTPEDNAKDREFKNRGAKNKAKLTQEQVKEIRALKGEMTTRALGKKYGVDHSNIVKIHTGQNWKNG